MATRDRGPARADAVSQLGAYDGDVSPAVLNASHRLQLAAIPRGSRVLDAGCASGATARLLTERGCSVTGFEMSPERGALAERHCERVVVGDLESGEDRARIEGPFDVIVLGDVLEHVRRPTEVLAGLRALLAPEGCAVVSIPNVGVWRGRLTILRGRFPHDDSGLFDRTHLRFFTRAGIHELVRDAGYRIVSEEFAGDQLPRPLFWRRFLSPGRMEALRGRLAAAWPEFFAIQIILVLVPA